MKKLIAAGTLAVSLLVVPVASASLRAEATHLRAQVVREFGRKAPGRNIVRDGFWTGRRSRPASPAELRGYVRTLERMLAPPPRPATAAATARSGYVHQRGPFSGRYTPASAPVAAGGGYGSVSGVPPGFASCVALRESTNGAGSPNIYGILPSNGYSPGMSVAAQKQLFSQMYAKSGVSPWQPYDHCS